MKPIPHEKWGEKLISTLRELVSNRKDMDIRTML
jgi:hypothetical protein